MEDRFKAIRKSCQARPIRNAVGSQPNSSVPVLLADVDAINEYLSPLKNTKIPSNPPPTSKLSYWYTEAAHSKERYNQNLLRLLYVMHMYVYHQTSSLICWL